MPEYNSNYLINSIFLCSSVTLYSALVHPSFSSSLPSSLGSIEPSCLASFSVNAKVLIEGHCHSIIMFNSSIRTLLLSKTTIPLSRESGIRGYEISYNNTVNGVKNHCLQDYIVHQRCSITVLNWNRPMEGLSFREFSQIRSNTRKRQEIKKIKGDDFFIREKRKENSARKDEKRKIKQEINKRINARKKFKAEKHATKPQSRINIKHAITAHKEWVTGQSEQSVKKEEPSKSRSKDKNARSTPIEKDPKQKKDSKREKKVSTKEEKSKVTKEKIPPRVKEETANPTEPIVSRCC